MDRGNRNGEGLRNRKMETSADSKKKENVAENKYEDKIITIPNLLSFLRLCMLPVIVWLYLKAHQDLWAGVVLILSGLTDLADGYIARRFHMISNFGKMLDPFADRLTQIVMLSCLLVRFPLMVVPFVLLIVKELFMCISGAVILKKTGRPFSAKWYGKLSTVFLYATMILHLFLPGMPKILSDILILLCTAVTGLSFALYMVHNIKMIKEASGKEKAKG